MSTDATTVKRGLPNPVHEALARFGLDGTDFDKMAGPLGVTPKEAVLTIGTMKLQHYQAQTEDVYRVPLLIVTSIVNQPYILDLVPGQSMIETLVQSGFDVYAIEWGRPRREHKDLTLDHYVLKCIPEAIARVQEISGERDVSVLGYCLGGLLAVLYAATQPGAPLKNLVCLAAPVDSDGLVSLKAWMGQDFDAESLLKDVGNVPADFVQNALRALRPFGKVAGAANLLNNLENEDVVRSNLRMGKWETDNVPFPGGVFRQMVNDFLRRNALVKGKLRIGTENVSLKNIRVPFLHVLAQDDHITPYASSHPLVELISSKDKSEAIIKGGHVGLVAGRGAQSRMWPTLIEWLAPRSE